MDIMSLLTSLLSGGVGGNAVGALLKNKNLGPKLNSILGVIGGGLGGQLLAGMLGMDGGLTSNIAMSAGSGLVLTFIASLLKKPAA